MEEELKSEERDPEGRKRMIEILKRVREQDLKNTDFESESDEGEEEEGAGQSDEQLDSDDEEDVINIYIEV